MSTRAGSLAAPLPDARTVRRRLAVVVPAFGLISALVLVVAPTLGSTPISLRRAFDPSIPWADNIDAQIFFVARLPRVLAGALVGSTLAAAGVVMQALLRNPLATPFTLGVSAAAALGAMSAIALNLDLTPLGATAVPVMCFSGAMIGTALVYFLATRMSGGLSTNVLLLAGVTLNTLFSALITFVQYLVDAADWYRTARWLLGNLDVSSFNPILAATPLIGLSLVLFATAGAQALVAVIALVAGQPVKGPVDLVFIGLWVASGLLFRQATMESAPST